MRIVAGLVGLVATGLLLVAGVARAQECCVCEGCPAGAAVCFDEGAELRCLTLNQGLNPVDFPDCAALCQNASCTGFHKTSGPCLAQFSTCPQGHLPAPAAAHGTLLLLALLLSAAGAVVVRQQSARRQSAVTDSFFRNRR